MKVNNKLKLKVILANAIAILAIANSVANAAERTMPPANVKMAQAQEQELAQVMTVPGTVVSRNDGRIAAEVSGRLLQVAEVGKRVEKGDVIAELDSQPLQLQLMDNIAAIKRLEASLKYQERQVNRLEKLSNTNNAAVTQLDQAISQRDMVAQDLARAKVTKQTTEYQLERTKIRAPYPGQVVERFQQAGEFSSVGREVVRLVDTTHIEISALAPVKLAASLIENTMVEVEGDNNRLMATIRSVIAVGDERSRNIEVRISIPASSWAVGAPVRIHLPTERARRVVTVPRDAIILRQNEVYLYKVNGENKASKISVKTGIGHGEFIEVLGNVQSGDMVVIRGGERLRDGQPVKEINQESKT